MKNASAYTGGLTIAALEAAIEMGGLIGDTDMVSIYSDWFMIDLKSVRFFSI